jgi:hypothetical protein
MAWERRRNGELYYYRKERIKGKIRSRYIGCGSEAELYAFISDENRKATYQKRMQIRSEIKSIITETRHLDSLVKNYSTILRPYINNFYISHGFHLHRGQWRRKNMNLITNSKSEKFSELYQKVRSAHPKKEDVNALREMLTKDPYFSAALIPLANATAERVITSANSDPVTQDIIRANLLAFRKEIGYETAQSLEKGLIDQVALNWLRMISTEQLYNEKIKQGITMEGLLLMEKRLSIVQNRYFRALETLARIRKIRSSLIVMNIAAPGSEQTVNQAIIQQDKKE